MESEVNRARTPIRIALAGRLTGPKGTLARRLLRDVFPRFPAVQFVVFGGPVDQSIRDLAGPNVKLTGWVTDLADRLRGMDLVIGSGRVALEAMQSGVPVLAVGEARHVGFIAPDTFPEARRTNFGDCEHGAAPDIDAVTTDIARFVAGFRPETKSYSTLLTEYEADTVAGAVENVYQEARLERCLSGRSIPVLCYHRVVATPPTGSRANIYVTRDVFERQLGQLARRGFTTITFSDLLDSGKLPKRPIILTFDDGYRDNHEHLLPLLEAHAQRAVIFALGDRRIRSNVWDSAAGEPEAALMSDAELRACHASGLLEIGAHGLTHRPLPELSDKALDEELHGSKAALENVLGTPVRAFAYPFGAWGERERRAVKRAGYGFGIATDKGRPLAVDRYAIARRLIFPSTNGFGFWKKSSSWYPGYRRLLGRPA